MGISPNSFFFSKKKINYLHFWDFLILHQLLFRLEWSDSFVPQAFPKGENYLGKVMGEVCNHTTFVFIDKWGNSDPGSLASTI